MRKFPVSALVLGFILLTSSPALAHDELVSSTPTADSTVEAGPIQINLAFEESPLALEFGTGNLIAVADAITGEQLGPACAKIEGSNLIAKVNLQTPGKYKILWRVVSADGHVVSGDYLISVENNSNYSTNRVGNQCFDDEGNELDITKQTLMSKKVDQSSGLFEGFLWGLGFVVLGSVAAALIFTRRDKSAESKKYQ